MESQFEVRYYSTHKMLAEFARKYSIGPNWPLTIVVWLIYFVLVVPMIVRFGWEENILLVCLGVILFFVTFLPQWYAKNVFRQTKKQNDGVLPETIVTFGENIEMHEGMVHLTIEYRKVEKVIRLKHSYMLMLGKRNGVMLDPNGFSKGTFEEFKQFLREKRPDLKIPE